jgi:hypothetical protein
MLGDARRLLESARQGDDARAREVAMCACACACA